MAQQYVGSQTSFQPQRSLVVPDRSELNRHRRGEVQNLLTCFRDVNPVGKLLARSERSEES